MSLEVLGWDPVDRKVFVAEHVQEGGQWLPPALGVFLLDADDPSLLVPLADPADLVGLPGHGELSTLRRVLEPLEPVEPVGLEVRERLMSVSPCDDSPVADWQPPCREDRVQLAWLGQVQELRLRGWGGSEVLGTWVVPGTELRLVVHTYLTQGGVLGRPQETALLFHPVPPPPASPPPEATAGEGHAEAALDRRRLPVIRQY